MDENRVARVWQEHKTMLTIYGPEPERKCNEIYLPKWSIQLFQKNVVKREAKRPYAKTAR